MIRTSTHIKLVLFLAVLFLNSSSSFSQSETPFDPEGETETWAIKGKVLPWMGLMSGHSGIAGLIGVEYGFKKRHSIGIDLFLQAWHLDEDRYDTLRKEYVNFAAEHNRNKAVFFNYRYYFNAENARSGGVVPYTGLFSRIGMIHTFYDEGYDTHTVHYNEMHYSAGVLLGIIAVPTSKKTCIDFNLGFFYKKRDTTDTEQVASSEITSTWTNYYYGIRLGLNLYFWGERKSLSKSKPKDSK